MLNLNILKWSKGYLIKNYINRIMNLDHDHEERFYNFPVSSLIQVNEGSVFWTHRLRSCSVTFVWTLERARPVRNCI